MRLLSITFPAESIERLCHRWHIRRMALFGSILRDDVRPDSDVDVLVTFEENATWSSWDLLDLQSELEKLFGREVDLVEERSLQNPFRRRSILRSQQVIYGAD